MLYYDRIYISEVIDLAKITTVKNAWFVAISFLVMDLNFNIILFLFARIMSCSNYKQYSLLIKSKGIITIKHGTIQIQYP